VLTHLCPRYSDRVIPLLSTPIPLTLPLLITPKSTTILERRLTKKALLDAQITPKARRVPSPYYNPNASSLYVFDHKFYNSDIINGDVSFKDAVFSCKTNH
jgi:hypothetical protein